MNKTTVLDNKGKGSFVSMLRVPLKWKQLEDVEGDFISETSKVYYGKHET